MDFERLRQTLAARPDAQHQAVSVNQRHLIDKILARYSAEYTVYREVLQNGNDAGATQMQVLFETANDSGGGDKRIKTITLRNNGRPFSDADWHRLMSIAEGNPDEQKIGFFGVGFYSLFSICEEPMVVSGTRCLSFYWQRDQLYSRFMDDHLSSQIDDDHDDDDASWTSIYLSLREPIECPNMDTFAQFMAKSLLFTVSLESVMVSVDRQVMFKVLKRTSPEQPLPHNLQSYSTRPSRVFTLSSAHTVIVQVTLDKRYSSEPESKGFFTDLWRVTRESLSKDSDLYDRVRRPGTFNMFFRLFRGQFAVQLPRKVITEMERVTKKKPQSSVTVTCLYSSLRELEASDVATEGKVKHPVLHGVLPIQQQQQHPNGHIFIGFETHQTTGLSVHCSAPFIPTVERETIDFVDSAVRTWNQELVGAVGLMARLIWDHELVNDLSSPSPSSSSATLTDYHRAADHLIRSFSFSTTSPLPVIADLLRDHFITTNTGLMVPTSVGMRPVGDLRIIPDDLSSILKQTPQAIGQSADFNALLARTGAVKVAGPQDLLTELQSRPLTAAESVLAIKWCLNRKTDISDQHGRSLLAAIKIPCGADNHLVPLDSVHFVVVDDGNVDWSIPQDCANRPVSKLLDVDAWQSLSIHPLPLHKWLQAHLSAVTPTVQVFEDIFIVLSTQQRDRVSDQEMALCCSILSNIPCIPTTHDDGNLVLRTPNQVVLEDVASFGSSSNLPTVSFKRRHLIDDGLLKAVGVRSHVPLAELIKYYDDTCRRVNGNISGGRLLTYLFKIQDDLNGEEWDLLQKARIFGGEVKGEGVRAFLISELCRDSRVARVLDLPVLTGSIDYSEERLVRLLRRLKFSFFVPFEKWLHGLTTLPKHRILLYEYFFEHIEYYQKSTSINHQQQQQHRHPFEKISMVWCKDDQLYMPGECFTDQRVSLLGLPVVRPEIGRSCEHLLHVQRRPVGGMIVKILLDSDLLIDATLIDLLADCEYTGTDYYELSMIKLFNNRTATPRESFFKVPTDFAQLFTAVPPLLYTTNTVNDANGNKKRQFLSACGVREEPHANELMMACAVNAEPVLLAMGVKKYTALMRLFAVHLESMSEEAIRAFKRSRAFLGLSTVDVNAATATATSTSSASLYDHDGVFIGDDVVTVRQFAVPVAPAGDDIVAFYMAMGCRRVSDMVSVAWMADSPTPDPNTAVQMLIRGKARIIVKEAAKQLTTKDAEQALRQILSLQIAHCRSITVTKTWNGQTRQLSTSAAHDRQHHRLIHTGRPDPFDLAQALLQVIHHGDQAAATLSDTLLVSTLLTMPMESLVERGFASLDGHGDDSDGTMEDSIVDIQIGSPPPQTSTNATEKTSSTLATKTSSSTSENKSIHTREQKIRKPKLLDKFLSLFGADLTKSLTHAGKPRDLDDVLRDGVKASRPNAGSTVHKDGARRPPPIRDEHVEEATGDCVIPNDLVCAGRLSPPLPPFELYTTPGQHPPPAAASLAQLANHLSTLATIFSISPQCMHIFHDPTSRSIAFNRAGSLFFNATHAHQPLAFWYMTMCHELAHNFWGPHDERHEHYMMSFAERYLHALIPHLKP